MNLKRKASLNTFAYYAKKIANQDSTIITMYEDTTNQSKHQLMLILFILCVYRFQCNICLIVSLNKTKLAQHMRANHMFKCNDCPKVFLLEEECLNHSITHLIKKNIVQLVYLTCLFYLMRNTFKNSDPISLSDNQGSSFEIVKSAKIPRINRRRLLNKAEEVKEFCKYDLSTYDDE